jgi:hypothetical protein
MTTEPSLALQTAIRGRLVGTAAVLALVPTDHIRDGATRPENFPTIIIGDGQTVLEGYYTGRRNVTVYLDVHVWTLEDGLAGAKAIAHAVSEALAAALDVPGYLLSDGLHVEQARYFRDPSKAHGHAVLSVRAFMSGEFGQ